MSERYHDMLCSVFNKVIRLWPRAQHVVFGNAFCLELNIELNNMYVGEVAPQHVGPPKQRRRAGEASRRSKQTDAVPSRPTPPSKDIYCGGFVKSWAIHIIDETGPDRARGRRAKTRKPSDQVPEYGSQLRRMSSDRLICCAVDDGHIEACLQAQSRIRILRAIFWPVIRAQLVGQTRAPASAKTSAAAELSTWPPSRAARTRRVAQRWGACGRLRTSFLGAGGGRETASELASRAQRVSLRPISLLRSSLLRFVVSTFPGYSLWA